MYLSAPAEMHLQAPKNAFSCFLKVVAKLGWSRDRSCSCRPEQGKSNVWELRTGIPRGVLQRISRQSLGLGTPGHLTAADTAYVKEGPQPHWGIVCTENSLWQGGEVHFASPGKRICFGSSVYL